MEYNKFKLFLPYDELKDSSALRRRATCPFGRGKHHLFVKEQQVL